MERHGSSSFGITTELEDFAVLLEVAEFPEEYSVKEHCIYRVPQKIRQIKEASYTPRIVSIGPFNNGEESLKLKQGQGLKLSYLKSFLRRSRLRLEDCISKLKEWESSIRNCYAESIPLTSDPFLMMILTDAGFIIELFLRYYNVYDWVRRDPYFLKPWVAEDVFHDLILLENQLPFFVLQDLFILAPADVTADFPTFLQLTFDYFAELNPQKLQPDGVSVQHFTDLLRIFHLSPSQRFQTRSAVGHTLDHLYCASELVNAGLRLKVDGTKKCLLELHYVKGVLTMPRLDVSDWTEIHLRNIVAFEQYHYPSETYITDYLKVLDFLINSERDVDILIHKRIITTLLGGSNEVATMINRLGSNLIQPNMNLEYLSICEQLNAFHDRPINKWKGQLKNVIRILLSLTLLQTICSVISLFKA